MPHLPRARSSEVLGECLDADPGRLQRGRPRPARAAPTQLEALAARLGLLAAIAVVDGDDLAAAARRARGRRRAFAHLDTRRRRSAVRRAPLTANAYLGGWGIAEALARGADVVVTGRVTDAALVVGPAAWRFGWARDDWDALAGAVAAGHIIECGAQATGGNYCLLRRGARSRAARLPDRRDARGRLVRHHQAPRHRRRWSRSAPSRRSCSTRSRRPRYLNPDVTARFDTPRARPSEGPDRVRVSGARGEPPPPHLKVASTTRRLSQLR